MSQDLYMLLGVYGLAKDLLQVLYTLVLSRREDLLVVRKSFTAVAWIVLRFQLIVKGRAKILLGVEFFLPNHMSFDICMCKRMSVICSRKGVCSCVDIL